MLNSAYQAVRTRWCACAADADVVADAGDGVKIVNHAVDLLLVKFGSGSSVSQPVSRKRVVRNR